MRSSESRSQLIIENIKSRYFCLIEKSTSLDHEHIKTWSIFHGPKSVQKGEGGDCNILTVYSQATSPHHQIKRQLRLILSSSCTTSPSPHQYLLIFLRLLHLSRLIDVRLKPGAPRDHRCLPKSRTSRKARQEVLLQINYHHNFHLFTLYLQVPTLVFNVPPPPNPVL